MRRFKKSQTRMMTNNHKKTILLYHNNLNKTITKHTTLIHQINSLPATSLLQKRQYAKTYPLNP